MNQDYKEGGCDVVAGKTNNAHFLQLNFKCTWNKDLDTTLFELGEERLVKYIFKEKIELWDQPTDRMSWFVYEVVAK